MRIGQLVKTSKTENESICWVYYTDEFLKNYHDMPVPGDAVVMYLGEVMCFNTVLKKKHPYCKILYKDTIGFVVKYSIIEL